MRLRAITSGNIVILLLLLKPDRLLRFFFCSATKPCLFGRTLDTNSATGPSLSQKPVVRQTKSAKDLLDIGASLYHISLLPIPIPPLKSYISPILFSLSEYMPSKNWLRKSTRNLVSSSSNSSLFSLIDLFLCAPLAPPTFLTPPPYLPALQNVVS